MRSNDASNARKRTLNSMRIEFIKREPKLVVARMKVNNPLSQSFSCLDGVALMPLAAAMADAGGRLNVDQRKFDVGLVGVGAQYYGMPGRKVMGAAMPIFCGQVAHVWVVQVVDETGEPFFDSDCTLAVKSKRVVSESTRLAELCWAERELTAIKCRKRKAQRARKDLLTILQNLQNGGAPKR